MASKRKDSKGDPKKIMAHIKSIQQNGETNKDIIVYNDGSSSDVVPRFQEMTPDSATKLFYEDNHTEHNITSKKKTMKQRTTKHQKNHNLKVNDENRLALDIFDKIMNSVETDNIIELQTSIEILYSAFDKTKLPEIFKDHKHIADVQCLLGFNNFQIHLYNKLNLSTKDSKSEVDAIKDVFIITYKSYMEFTDNFQSPNKKIMTLLDRGNLDNKWQTYIIYELYYRKMDLHIAIIFLDNLHKLKQRLEMPDNAYQEIECSLYYFVYSVIEDWKVYLPANRPVYQNTITLNTKGPKNYGDFLRMNVAHDPQQVYNAPVILLERKKFRNVLNLFVKTLSDTTTERNPQKDKIPDKEINTLSLLPYMRDDYSLKKILKYINTISKLDFKRDKLRSILIIQRVIHVLGEFTKNSETGETCHLSPTTKAILHAEIPYNIVKIIEDIRDAFAHPKKGKLVKRIDLEINEPEVFENLLVDIYEINKAITEVVKLYRPILEESRINSGFLLLEENGSNCDSEDKLKHLLLNTHYLKKLQDKTQREKIQIIGRKLSKYSDVIQLILVDIEKRANNVQTEEFNRIDWLKITNIFQFLIIEVDLLSLRDFPFTFTENDWELLLGNSYTHTIAKFSQLLQFTRKFYHNKKFNIFSDEFLNEKSKLTQILYENETKEQNISSKEALHNFKKKTDVDQNTNKKTDTHFIKRLLQELSGQSNSWNEIIKNDRLTDGDNIKLREYIEFITTSLEDFWKIALGNPDFNGITCARRLLNNIKKKYEIDNLEDQTTPSQEMEPVHNYKHIQVFSTKMNRKWFLTSTEIEFLMKNINFNGSSPEESSNFSAHYHSIALKIQNNDSLTGTEFKKLKTLNMNEKCRKTVENLVMGYARDSKMLECLMNRIQHLKHILNGSQDEKLLVLRYKHDDIFRVVTEIVISDIMNIFKDENLKGLSETTFSKMLSGFLLRNVLNHGNPHLDVIGAALNTNDVPNALVSFALKIVNDGQYLESLFKLYKDDVDRHDVFCSKNLIPEHTSLVMNFKKCNEWKAYIKLLPTKKNKK